MKPLVRWKTNVRRWDEIVLDEGVPIRFVEGDRIGVAMQFIVVVGVHREN